MSSDQFTPGDWEAVLRFLQPRVPLYCPHEPTEKQKAFLRCESLEVLFGGMAGGGKSDALLMAALQYVDTPSYAAIIFRNTFSDLSLPGSLMERAHEWLDPHPDLHWDENKHRWTFPSGASLTFGYLDKPKDHLRYKSAEFQFCGFDEVTEIQEKHYRYLFSRLRRPSGIRGHALSKVPLRMRAASNPAPNWVRRRFLEEGQKTGRIYIPSGLVDNPYVDINAYRAALANLDEVERARLERGDWYAEDTGSKFKKEWFNKIIDRSEVPSDIQLWRYWDLASTIPSERNPDPDWTAGALCGMHEGFLYVVHVERFRKDPAGVEKAIQHMAQVDGVDVKIRMEQEGGASGKNTIDHYSRFVLLGFDFDGHPTNRNKETRADPWAAKAKRGEVILVRGDWHTEFLDEAGGFPETSPHDDQIDAVSGAFECITGLGQKQRRAVEIIV